MTQQDDVEAVKRAADSVAAKKRSEDNATQGATDIHVCKLPTDLTGMSGYVCPQCYAYYKVVVSGGTGFKLERVHGHINRFVCDDDDCTEGHWFSKQNPGPIMQGSEASYDIRDAAVAKALDSVSDTIKGIEGAAGIPVQGDIIRKGLPFDENLEAAKQFVSGLYGGEPSEVSTTAPGPINQMASKGKAYSAVEPPHYSRGPKIVIDIGSQITMGRSKFEYVASCIDVMRHIKDPRLATAFKYVWRVAFGGKREPGETRTQREIDTRDIESAIWYLKDWLNNPT